MSPTRNVLVVEDEAIISMAIEDFLTDAGHCVVGPAGTVASALALLREVTTIDCALLDVNLRGEKIYPVAEILRARGARFAFMSGYGESGIDPAFQSQPVFSKPIDQSKVLAFIAAAT